MSNKILVFTLFLGVLLAGCGTDGGGAEPSGSPGEPIKDLGPAPQFRLSDYQGNQVTMADFAGQPAVINSWAVWCPFCREELKSFARAQQEFGNQATYIAINRAESKDTAKGFTDEIGVTDQMIFLLDPEDNFYQAIGGFSMPETIFVDKEGPVRIHKRGPMTLGEIREKTNALLSNSE